MGMRSELEEARLARAAAAGDGQAFAQLYDRYEKPIYNYCLRLLGNEHDAQDATQEAFLKVMRRLPEMGEREFRFGPYLYTTARNASYDMIGRRKKADPVEKFGDAASPVTGDGPAIEDDPVRAALLEAERDSIRLANSRLPERQREVLALREVEGLSYEEIAGIMEMNSNSVAQLISRARIRLRQELRGEAAAAITASSPDCQKALPLLARRQDGNLKSDEDRLWLEQHLAGCPTCPLADQAMAEAGISYRAWAPVVPAAWLFRDTVAKASEIVGADWSHIERPGQAANGSAGGGEGTGSAGGATGPAGPTAVQPLDEPVRRRRRRAPIAALIGAGLFVFLFAGVVLGGKTGDSVREPEPAVAEKPQAKKAGTKPAKQKPKKTKAKKKATPASAAQPESPEANAAPTPVSVPQTTESTRQNRKQTTQSEEKRPAKGTGNWGSSRQPETTAEEPSQPEPGDSTTPSDPTTPTDPTTGTDPPAGGPDDPTRPPGRPTCRLACTGNPIP